MYVEHALNSAGTACAVDCPACLHEQWLKAHEGIPFDPSDLKKHPNNCPACDKFYAWLAERARASKNAQTAS